MNDFNKFISEKIIEVKPISGGCIGSSYFIKTSESSYFLKHYKKEGVAEAEAIGLNELSIGNKNNIKVHHYDKNCIILNFIKEGPRCISFYKDCANLLVNIHKIKSDLYGFNIDNFIGDNKQLNLQKNSWRDFFLENRLGFQLDMAKKNGYDLTGLFKRSAPAIKSILDDNEEEPTLLHGDLWGGNLISNSKGQPVFIDPAIYYGHRECDIAMTKLFGGFSSEFYMEYNRLYPLKKGWENRVDLYNLYHILNHLNIFGRSYLSQAESILKSYAFGA